MSCMKVIGITGPCGSGKSFLCGILSDFGIPSVNADEVYHALLVPPSECADAILKEFGDAATEGKLDRKKLAAKVFSDKKALERLNEIAFGFICPEVKRIVSEYAAQGCHALLLDAPTLYESGLDKICAFVICVNAPFEERLRRIRIRDGISEESALMRLNARDESFFEARADYVVLNESRNTLRLRSQVVEILKKEKILTL